MEDCYLYNYSVKVALLNVKRYLIKVINLINNLNT
jgi:hypothetical protein